MARRAAAQQPEWPDAAALAGARTGSAPHAAARVRRRGPLAADRARAVSPPATPSSSRPATAPSPSTEFSADNIREKLKVILQMSVVLTLLARRADREGRPDRRPVRQAPFVPDFETGRRPRAAVVPRPHRQRLASDAAARPARPGAPAAQAYHQSAVDAEPAARLHQGRLRRPRPGARVEPGVRGVEPRGSALRAARRRDRPGAALHAGAAASTSDTIATCTRSTSTRPTRRCSSATRRRSPGGLADRRLVRLLGAHAVDRRAHPADSTARTSSSSAGCGNPIGCKLGPDATPDEVRRAVPPPQPGARSRAASRSISRMGADHVEDALPPLLRAVTRRGPPRRVGLRPDARQHVRGTRAGRKTRHFDDIMREIGGFFASHQAEGTWPGGIHVELTGDDVDRVPRRRRRRSSTASSTTATRPSATRASTPARASTSRSGSPSSYDTERRRSTRAERRQCHTLAV